jgi:hypothetical protein
MFISPSSIKNIARDQLGITRYRKKTCFNHKFRAFFGFGPKVTARIWNTLTAQELVPEGGRVVHLLWTLCFLKLYDTEAVLSTIFDVCEKTYRKWVWKFLKKIYLIDLVRLLYKPTTISYSSYLLIFMFCLKLFMSNNPFID